MNDEEEGGNVERQPRMLSCTWLYHAAAQLVWTYSTWRSSWHDEDLDDLAGEGL
jgi:hypothetical protein